MALLACVEEGSLGFVLVWKEFTRKLSHSSHDLKEEINHHAELPCAAAVRILIGYRQRRLLYLRHAREKSGWK